jgi:hypothetical protein
MDTNHSQPEHGNSGCGIIAVIIGSSIVVTGIIFFVGRSLFGGTGAYFLFYGLLLTGILGIILGSFIRKWRAKRKNGSD